MRLKYWKIIGGTIVFWILFFVTTGHTREILTISTGPATNIGVQMAEPVITEVYSRLGIDVKFQHYPWSRSIYSANLGETSAELFRSSDDQEKYPNLIKVNIPLGYSEFLVFSKNFQFEVTGWDSIKSYHLCFLRGMYAIERYTQGMQVEQVDSYEQAFKILDLGRTDLVIGARTTALIVLHRSGLTDIRVLHPPLIRTPLYHYLHISRADLIPDLEQIFKAMTAAGEIKAIQNRIFQNILDSQQKDP